MKVIQAKSTSMETSCREKVLYQRRGLGSSSRQYPTLHLVLKVLGVYCYISKRNILEPNKPHQILSHPSFYFDNILPILDCSNNIPEHQLGDNNPHAWIRWCGHNLILRGTEGVLLGCLPQCEASPRSGVIGVALATQGHTFRSWVLFFWPLFSISNCS